MTSVAPLHPGRRAARLLSSSAVSSASSAKKRVEPLQPGQTVADRYRVVRVLGQGGMGQVLEVEHHALGRRFALKVLRLERWNDELVRRFNREARALGSVTTPRVAQVTDFGVDSQAGPFYVMELLDGETLEDCLERDGRLPLPRALHVCAELAEALADVHEQGIVHRDLKPSNVGLPNAGPVVVKLLDFGLAASMDDAFLSRITQSQQILGSLPYMAPEQFNGADPAITMDIYAVGVCLYESLTGRLPFLAPNTAAMIHQILSTPVPTLPPELASVPGLTALLDRLLHKEPTGRFANARAAGAAIRQVLGRPADSIPPETRLGQRMPKTSENPAGGGADRQSLGHQATMMAEPVPEGIVESGMRLSSTPRAPAAPPSQHPPAPHAQSSYAHSSYPGGAQPGWTAPAQGTPTPAHAATPAPVPPTPAAGVYPGGTAAMQHGTAPMQAASYPGFHPGQELIGAPPTAPGGSGTGLKIAAAGVLGLFLFALTAVGVAVGLSMLDDDDEPRRPARHAQPAPAPAPDPAPAVQPTPTPALPSQVQPEPSPAVVADADDTGDDDTGEVDDAEPVRTQRAPTNRRSRRSRRAEPPPQPEVRRLSPGPGPTAPPPHHPPPQPRDPSVIRTF